MSSEQKSLKMIKRLRRRIVLIVTLTAGLLIVLALSAMMVLSYNSSYQDIHRALKQAVQDGPTETLFFSVGKHTPEGSSSSTEIMYESYVPSAIYVIDSSGSIIASNENIVSMDESVRDYSISVALERDDEEGLISESSVFYRKSVSDNVTNIAFVDATSFLAQQRATFITLTSVSVLILLALFLLSTLIARMITRPIQEAWDQQSKFIADASHELKTPLTVLLANTDIMLSHPEFSEDEREYWLNGCKSEGERMKGLIEDMLTLARGEQTEHAELKDLPMVDLSALAERASLAFEAVAFEKGVTVDEEIESGISTHGDEGELERMVRTLVDNAVKYAGKDGRVLVRLVKDHNGHATLSVNNTGDPIAKEDLPHVFDRFWRSDEARSRSSSGGYGLGLSIAKHIAYNHNAKMSVTSDAEHGTTFSVVF